MYLDLPLTVLTFLDYLITLFYFLSYTLQSVVFHVSAVPRLSGEQDARSKKLSNQMWLNIARRLSWRNLKKYNTSRRNIRSRQVRSDMSTALLEKVFFLMAGTLIIYHWKGKEKGKMVNVHSNKRRRRKVEAECYTSWPFRTKMKRKYSQKEQEVNLS